MPVEIQLTKESLIEQRLLESVKRRLNKALRILKLPHRKVSVVFMTDEEITQFNLRFLGRNYPTNVISFPFRREKFTKYLGEVLVSIDRVKDEAKKYGLEFKNYLLMILIHGILHLLDHDHEKGVYAPYLMLKNELKLFKEIAYRKGKRECEKFLKRREYMPAKLAVNVDHVATVREARKAPYPDPVHAAVLAELGGADGIVVHLRLDRRHIKERDVKIIKGIIKTKLILEMAVDEDLIKFARELKPYQVTLVPERIEEVTTEGGMNLEVCLDEVSKAVKELNQAGIKVSLFINPEEKAVELSKKAGAQIVEIHTGIYAEATKEEDKERELERIEVAARIARDLDLIVHAGHGLSYENIQPVAAIPEIEEFSIGHSIVSRAIFVGMKEAVKEMKELILKSRGY